MLSPGDRLGRYEVVSPLGAGGMGEVYRARDTELGREVALKVLPEAVAGDPARLKRFEREARATAALSHPNVVTVFDVGSDDGRAFVVTELLEGTTLGARLRRGAVPVGEALSLAAQAARGLAAAHAGGIVHRDLKPDNLFVTTSGVLKVLDFGLARVETGGGAQTQETTEANATGPGTVLGTVSYMSPEQARGLGVDGRSDLFSLGVVLHEMLSGKHPFKRASSAETVSAILRDEPPELGALEGAVPRPVGALVRRCLEKRPEDRFQTANDLSLALEVLGRGEEAGARPPSGPRAGIGGATTEERPYPGLSSFTEADAGQFFGREEEVKALWEKLGRQRLLAVIGPSGVGKTSFLRAGVMAHAPAGWACVYMTPGTSPVAALARAVSAGAGDGARASDLHGVADELMQGLFEFLQHGETSALVSAIARWRAQRSEVLLVVDQAEEVFTLNPPETQERFAALVGRLVEDAGLRVVLSLRDDFLFRCHGHGSLGPVFHDLTPLGPPSAAALRRALVEPAARLGVRFEDDDLVGEMVAVVAEERGALPLLAFAASRLWEERDREKKRLTREAYERIGGVEGALARHAEATLQRIGPGREATVREIFRNLVTAEGTRASREREELLSVFRNDPGEAGVTLDALVEARLLTEYEVAPQSARADVSRFPSTAAAKTADTSRGAAGNEVSERPPAVPGATVSERADTLAPLDHGGTGASDQGRSRHAGAGSSPGRIEIVHESLMTHWPRLERWLAQDAEGALLRDQLGQAARLWDERGRPDDLLWSGTAYRELSLWRERYAGGLTAVEREFADAAAGHARRRRRRQRILVSAAILVLSVGLASMAALWVRSEQARSAAAEEARQREAAQLLGLGRLRFAERRSEALAYAIASLERADNAPARRFALEVLWDGPTEQVFGTDELGNMATFSPDGRWLATAGMKGAYLWRREGGPPRPLRTSSGTASFWAWLSSDGRHAAVKDPTDNNTVRVFSVEDGRETGAISASFQAYWLRRRLIATTVGEGAMPSERTLLRTWPLDGGEPTTLEPWDTRGLNLSEHIFDREGERLVEARDGVINLRRLDALGRVEHVLGRHEGARTAVFDPTGRAVLSVSPEEIKVWPLDRRDPGPARVLRAPMGDAAWGTPDPRPDPTGRFVAAAVRRRSQQEDQLCVSCTFGLVDLSGPPDHDPHTILNGPVAFEYAFDPTGRWLVSPHNSYLSLWFLDGPRSWRIPFPALRAFPVFSPDGRSVAVTGGREVRLLAMTPDGELPALVHEEPDVDLYPGLAYDPKGRFLVASSIFTGTLVVVPVPKGPVRHLSVPGAWGMLRPAISPDGTLVVAGYSRPSEPGSARLGVWDLETGERRDLDAHAPGEDCRPGGVSEGDVSDAAFLPDGRLVTVGATVLRLWDLAAGTSEKLRDCAAPYHYNQPHWIAVSPDGGQVVTLAVAGAQKTPGSPPSHLAVFDRETRMTREITTHGHGLTDMALDPTGQVLVTLSHEGVIRVGPLTGGEPHLLVGRSNIDAFAVDVSPDGRWIVAGSQGDGIRLWPMPDVSRPPLHTLPLEELLRKLRTHTNLRVVPDPGADTGYRVEAGPFPGWANPPEW